MDFGRRGKGKITEDDQYRSRSNRGLLRPSSAAAAASQTAHLSAPIPQTQWSDVPDVFRPPSWSFAPQGRDKPLPSPPITTQSTEAGSSSTALKRRKNRPGSLRSTTYSSLRPDPGLLYPEMSPYHPSEMVRSAPHDLQHFTQPPTLDVFTPRSNVDLRASSLPRSPTYPPGGSARARIRSISAGNDNALQDEEEFRLFIEATAGLGPIPTFRQNSVVEDNWLDPRREPRHPLPPNTMAYSPVSEYTGTLTSESGRQLGRDVYVSPIGETPTTLRALQGLAQMPRARSTSSVRRQRADFPDPVIDISDSGLNIWDDSTGEPMPPHPADSWVELEEPGTDDELPTYASSQAQAHASQIAEATRRAQELQRRWREGGRKYGPEI